MNYVRIANIGTRKLNDKYGEPEMRLKKRKCIVVRHSLMAGRVELDDRSYEYHLERYLQKEGWSVNELGGIAHVYIGEHLIYTIINLEEEVDIIGHFRKKFNMPETGLGFLDDPELVAESDAAEQLEPW